MYKIAISGMANSGKNTLSKMIVNGLKSKTNSYMSTKYMAFADPIKEMIRIMYPNLPRKFLYGSSSFRNEVIPEAFKNDKPLTIRQLLIDLGTELGRSYKENIWLDNFDNRFKSRHEDIVIVTDVRFRNEFEHLKKLGFYQIRLYRKTNSAPINHASETNQNTILDNEFNFIVDNNHSLKELKIQVDTIVTNLLDIK